MVEEIEGPPRGASFRAASPVAEHDREGASARLHDAEQRVPFPKRQSPEDNKGDRGGEVSLGALIHGGKHIREIDICDKLEAWRGRSCCITRSLIIRYRTVVCRGKWTGNLKRGALGMEGEDTNKRDEADLSSVSFGEAAENAAADEEGMAEVLEAAEEATVLERLRAELEEARERHIRLLAEFENFRRRTQRERTDLIKYQGEQIVIDLMDVIDNMERAMTFAQGDSEQFRGGVELIFRTFQSLLEKWGVRLESGMGKEFDPAFQSALSTMPSAEVEPGTVVGELKKAAFYKDKLIRVGEVVVAGPVQEQ